MTLFRKYVYFLKGGPPAQPDFRWLNGVSTSYLRGTGVLTGLVNPVLPCPGFPVKVLTLHPIRQSDRESGVLMAERAKRVTPREVELQYDLLIESERQSVIDVWADGRGAVQAFQFTVPGEGSAKLFVFKDQTLNLPKLGAARSNVTIRLLDVTPA